MIDYRMMDEEFLACYCLHGGPMPLQDCREPGVKPAWGESNAKVPQGTIAKYLRALCKTYGSCAVLAVEDDLAQGRIYPSLTKIKEVSAAIATAVAEVAYSQDLARKPKPDDLSSYIQFQMYEPEYHRYV